MVNIMSIISKVAPIAIKCVMDNIQVQNEVISKERTTASNGINLNINLNINRGNEQFPVIQESKKSSERLVIGMRYDL